MADMEEQEKDRMRALRPRRVLIVDDEQLIADTLAHILNMSGFSAMAVYNGESAIAATTTFCPDIVLSDVQMPGHSGMETGKLIRGHCPDARIILFSGHVGMGELPTNFREITLDFELWQKPIPPGELLSRLRALP